MKKRILLFAVLVAVLLCSCNHEFQSVSVPVHENEPSQVSSEPLKMVTSSWGAQEWCGTEDGFYCLNRISSNAYHLSYIDYENHIMTLLCPSPNCLHQDETCPAFFYVPDCGAAAFTDEKYLYIMTFADGSAERDNEFPRLYRLDKDGSNRELLLELSQGETFSRYVAADETALYVNVVGTELNKGLSDVSMIQKVSIEKGTVETVLNLSRNALLCGAYGESLIFQSVDIPDDLGGPNLKGIKNSLYEISLSSKRQTDVLDWSNGESACIVGEEMIFSFNYTDSAIYKKMILGDRSESLVYRIPDDVIYNQCIFNYLDSRILIFDLIEYGNPQTRRFAVSLQNNQLYEITLEYLNGEIPYPYTVFSGTSDGLLVQCGVQQSEEQGIFSNGEMDAFIYTSPLFGTIKISDYLNSENNIQVIS